MPLRQLVKVHIQFTPSDPRSGAVREFLKRCLSPKARNSNPDCEVIHRLRSDDAPPVVAVEFGNGFKDQFNCHKFKVDDIIARIQNVANEMETKALLAEAGFKLSDINLKAYVGPAEPKRASNRFVPKKGTPSQ